MTLRTVGLTLGAGLIAALLTGQAVAADDTAAQHWESRAGQEQTTKALTTLATMGNPRESLLHYVVYLHVHEVVYKRFPPPQCASVRTILEQREKEWQVADEKFFAQAQDLYGKLCGPEG